MIVCYLWFYLSTDPSSGLPTGAAILPGVSGDRPGLVSGFPASKRNPGSSAARKVAKTRPPGDSLESRGKCSIEHGLSEGHINLAVFRDHDWIFCHWPLIRSSEAIWCQQTFLIVSDQIGIRTQLGVDICLIKTYRLIYDMTQPSQKFTSSIGQLSDWSFQVRKYIVRCALKKQIRWCIYFFSISTRWETIRAKLFSYKTVIFVSWRLGLRP